MYKLRVVSVNIVYKNNMAISVLHYPESFSLWFVIIAGYFSYTHVPLIIHSIVNNYLLPIELSTWENQVTQNYSSHYSDVIMNAMASQITGVSIVCWTICSGAHQRKYQSTASLAFVRGIHQWSVDFPHKGPVTRKMCPFDDDIMRNPSQKTCLSIPSFLVDESFWNFVQSTAYILSCSVRNVRRIDWLKWMLSINKFLWYFSWRLVSGVTGPRWPLSQTMANWLLLVSVSNDTGKQWEIHWSCTTQFISPLMGWCSRDYFVYAPSQWETTL